MLFSILRTADEPVTPVHQPIFFNPQCQNEGVVENCTASRLRQLLNKLPQLNITATGTSMTPFIRSGERLTIRQIKAPHNLHCGDVILFENSSGELLLHRIITKKHGGNTLVLQTKGDNLSQPDSPIFPDMIIGRLSRLEKKLPFIGNRTLDLESWSWQTVSLILAWDSRFNLYRRLRKGCEKLLKRSRTRQIVVVE